MPYSSLLSSRRVSTQQISTLNLLPKKKENLWVDIMFHPSPLHPTSLHLLPCHCFLFLSFCLNS